jgi:hypothetical protein
MLILDRVYKPCAYTFSIETDHVEVDTITSRRWSELLQRFSDSNIYQTWPYGTARSGHARVSHVVVRHGSDVVAIAQARLAYVPGLNLGIAYILWGPLWRRRDRGTDVEVFRQALRALMAEYVLRRKMVVRINSNLPHVPNDLFRQILKEEGYVPQSQAKRRMTILMDIRPTMDELYRGLHQKWRNCLNKARKQGLELIEGEGEALFKCFEHIHAQMRERKSLVALTDPALYRDIQSELMPDQKMRVVLCKADGQICAGAICSALGDTGIYLFGATNDLGMKTCASYLVHWKILEWVKAQGCQSYDLNGINPVSNPGVYQFKLRLAGAHGREVHLLGGFDAYPGTTTRTLIVIAEWFRIQLQAGREFLARFVR